MQRLQVENMQSIQTKKPPLPQDENVHAIEVELDELMK